MATKSEVNQGELAKLTEIFADVDPVKAKLVEGLIKDAAFLAAENHELRRIIEKTGMVQVNIIDPLRQKTTEASKQYLKNLNSYSVVIKTLNGILAKNTIEGEDPFDEWLKQQSEE